MGLSLTNFTSATVINPTLVNANNDAIEALVNGGLTTTNLAPDAGILASQLAASYEHQTIDLVYGTGTAIPPAWPGGDAKMVYRGVPGTTADTGGNWVVTEIDWLCTDTGNGAAAFSVLWGGFTGNPLAWNTVATVRASTTMANGTGAGADSANAAALTGLSVTLTRQTYPCYLVLVSAAADAKSIEAAADQIVVSVKMRRAIAST